jgi:hypothetical protein
VLKFFVKINSVQSEKNHLADLVQERRRDLIRVESKWIQVVADIEADACQRVDEAFDSVVESELKTQRHIFASEIDCKKRIDHISRQSKRKIDELQGDLVLVQSQCHLQSLAAKDSERVLLHMKVAHAEEIATENIKHKRSIQELPCIHETSKFKFKCFVCEGLCKHAECSDKQKDQMNSLRELIFGQSNMIDGYFEENRDERRKSKQATNLAVSKEVLAVNRLAKVKLWKATCVELCACENEYAAQSSKIDDTK